MKQRLAIFLFVALVNFTPIGVHADELRSIKIDDTFVDNVWKPFNRPLPSMIIRWGTRAHNGIIHICGAVTYPNSGERAKMRAVLMRTEVTYRDKPIMKDLRFLTEVRRKRKFSGATAACRPSSQKAPNGRYNVSMKTPRF